MADKLTIRTAGLGDALGLAALGSVLGYRVVEESLALRLRNLLTRNEDIVLVVASEKGDVSHANPQAAVLFL